MRLLPPAVLLCWLLSPLAGLGADSDSLHPPFSGKRALNHVHALADFGPRPPGSEGIQKAREYIRTHLRRSYIDVEEIPFVAQTPYGSVLMTNFVAKIPGKSTDILVLAGHYDTVDTRKVPNFVGANDGGSSAGLLLELARVLAERRNELTIWLVFFDGEEAIREWSARDGLYGSRYLAFSWKRDGILPRIRAFILLDMVGDRDLLIRRDLNSTPWLTDLVWQAARDLGHTAHFSDQILTLDDDHTPFVRAGVPAVDLVDFDYGPGNRYWHTKEDTPDKLSARSLQVVGEVVLETVRRLEQRQ